LLSDNYSLRYSTTDDFLAAAFTATAFVRRSVLKAGRRLAEWPCALANLHCRVCTVVDGESRHLTATANDE
jgi:hypothetical protein